MPNRPTRFDNWSQGSNNVAQPDRLPKNHVRQLINLNATTEGTLELRAGFEKVLTGNNVRAVGRAGRKILIVDSDGLRAYDPLSNSAEAVAGAIGPGKIAAVEHNRELFLSTPAQTWRYDGNALKPWSILEPGISLSVQPGPFTGVVKIAVTALGEDNEESGCEPYIFSLTNQTVSITSTDPRPLRVYASPPNHESLYFQTVLHTDGFTLANVRDETARLITHGLRPFPCCEMLASYHGVIVGANDNYVVYSAPMMPHLINPIAQFVAYASPVNVLAATDGGVFVATDDATYFLTSLETTPAQRKVLDIGAVAGSGVSLPDGRAAWFTRYGQAIGAADGTVSLISADRLAPDLAAQGAAGYVEHNGNRLVVTTMRGRVDSGGLGIGFHSELET